MSIRVFLLPCVFALAPLGCGGTTSPAAGAVPVTGTVAAADGTPLKEVLCMFMPYTADQRQAKFSTDTAGRLVPPTKDGKLVLIPGKYKVLFEALPNKAAAFKQVPAKFHEGGDGVVEVTVPSGGGELTIKLS